MTPRRRLGTQYTILAQPCTSRNKFVRRNVKTQSLTKFVTSQRRIRKSRIVSSLSEVFGCLADVPNRTNATCALGTSTEIRQITFLRRRAAAFSAPCARRDSGIAIVSTCATRYLLFVRPSIEIDVHGTPIPRKQGNSNDKSRPPRSSRGEDRCLVGGS